MRDVAGRGLPMLILNDKSYGTIHFVFGKIRPFRVKSLDLRRFMLSLGETRIRVIYWTRWHLYDETIGHAVRVYHEVFGYREYNANPSIL